MQPPKVRVFAHGQTYNQLPGGDSLSDEEFDAAIAHLQLTLPDDQWEWVEAARRLASTPQDAEFLPFLISELLDTTPFTRQIRRGEEYHASNLQFKNGTVIKCANWMEANASYLWQYSDLLPTRSILLQLATGEEYEYEAYKDGTEQITLSARNSKNDVPPSSEERKMGLYAPTASTMKQFSDALQFAFDSGADGAVG